jgi:hypothetical protein
MGLLDDAIREHLELRRLRGADPGQVAREEQEAFGPVDRGGSHQPEDQAPDSEGHDDTAGEQGPVIPVEASSPASTPNPAVSQAGDETTELDMSTVLGEHTSQAAADLDAESLPYQDAATAAGDSLEWEIPQEQSAAAGEAAPPAEDPQELVEDVLEETPDFLRETPEQERLWFEQRPPRDFDFDK